MSKISFEDWKNSMSFMIDDEFDNNFLHSIEPLTQFIVNNCNRFSNHQQLCDFLSVDGDFLAIDKLKSFCFINWFIRREIKTSSFIGAIPI